MVAADNSRDLSKSGGGQVVDVSNKHLVNGPAVGQRLLRQNSLMGLLVARLEASARQNPLIG
jgi:hypothetical protein